MGSISPYVTTLIPNLVNCRISCLEITLKPRDPFRGAAGGSFLEQRLVIEWLESYRPVRQRTVRSETTKDKAGDLPPAIYTVHRTNNESEERVRFPEEYNVYSANAVPHRVVSIQFVDEVDVTEVFPGYLIEQDRTKFQSNTIERNRT